MGAGRPSKYKKEYCQLLITSMAQGFSFEAFAGEVGVHFDTLYAWVDQFPEFSEAKKLGKAQSLRFWEKKGIDNLLVSSEEAVPKFNTTLWIFNMKNRFGWRDKQPDEANASPHALLEMVNKLISHIEATQVGKPHTSSALPSKRKA